MFCKHCGEPIASGKKFCKNCGTEVKTLQTPLEQSPSSSWFGRHKKALIISLVVIAIVGIVAAFAGSSPSSETSSMSSEHIGASVVNILCTSKSGEESGGSGTIFTEDGVILTNAHVIPQIREIPNVSEKGCVVVLPDEKTGQPREIYYAKPEIIKNLSKQYDIATLQIDSVFVDENGKSWGKLPNTFPDFDSDGKCDSPIKLGDSVRIYGYPVTSGGYNLTVTDGIISSFNEDGTILTSAKIDSGNSGGLAIDQDKCFIGIPSAVVSGNFQNLGVLIPPNVIKDFMNEVPFPYSYSKVSCDANQCLLNDTCVARPAHSSCVENDPNNAWKCEAGYVDKGSYCIKPTPTPVFIEKSASQLCQEKYGWNTYSAGTNCQCSSGYTWNSSATACVTMNQRCATDYAYSTWNGTYNTQGGLTCGCAGI